MYYIIKNVSNGLPTQLCRVGQAEVRTEFPEKTSRTVKINLICKTNFASIVQVGFIQINFVETEVLLCI
jgi:hypothetical protein